VSLINDALKTAQRERSGQSAAGPNGQPLLEGFFPYVSTSPSEGRSRLGRVALISSLAVIVLGTAAWLGAPSLKRLFRSGPDRPNPIVLPPRQVASIPPQITPAVVQAADTQRSDAPRADTSNRATSASITHEFDQPPHDVDRPARRVEPTRSVAVEPQTVTRARDTVIVEPSAAIASAPEPRNVRPNYEAEAISAFIAGDYQTARSRFELAVRVAPTASAWTNYGVTLEKLGQPQAAIRAYRSATAVDAGYFNAWLYLARVYNVIGDVAQAVPLFDRAREIEPGNTDVNADLAELEYKSGAFAEARRFADVATQSNPANARAQYYLALAADTLKDRTVARQAFESYLRAVAGQERDNVASVGYARVRLQQLRDRP
jgi:Flp pilus assembly protein TadD